MLSTLKKIFQFQIYKIINSFTNGQITINLLIFFQLNALKSGDVNQNFEDDKQSSVDLRFDEHSPNGTRPPMEISQMPVVEKQIQELVELEKQQTELESWHEDMQRQLDIEKVKLAERYDELRLDNIQKQKSIIESSQDFLMSSMNTVHSRMDNSSSAVQHSLPYDRYQDSYDFPQSHELPNSPDIRTYPSLNNSCGTPSQQPLHESMTNNNQATYEFLNSLDLHGFSALGNVGSPTQQHSLPSEDTREKQCKYDLSPSSVHRNDRSDDSNVVQKPTCQTNLKDLNIHHQSGDVSKASGSELLLRHYQSVDAKLRRKSRAMKFFHTPEKTNKKGELTSPHSTHKTKQPSAFEHIREKRTPETATPLRSPLYSDLNPSITPTGEKKKELFPNVSGHGTPISPVDSKNISPLLHKSNCSPQQHLDDLTTAVTTHNLATPYFPDSIKSIDNEKVTSTPQEIPGFSPRHNLSRIYANEFPIADCNEVRGLVKLLYIMESAIAPSKKSVILGSTLDSNLLNLMLL